ncbi:MAG TPA: gliding motility-associated C-terminal domain-containing protein, partial [Cytophagaceae bacterium]
VLSSTLPEGVLSFPTEGTLQPGTDTLKFPLCFTACDKLLIEQDDVYYVRVKSQDFRCPVMEDTIDLVIKVIVPENKKPKVFTSPDSPFFYYANDTISIDVIGMDEDMGDLITLTANGDGFDLAEKGMSFKEVSGYDSISSKLEWVPDCDAFENQPYKIVFRVKDNSCIYSHEDSISIVINIQDHESTLADISVPNLITPNGDGLNDVFEIPALKGDMFPDNCEYYYKHVQIYNIWGAKVFESESRQFQWDPKGFPDGIYFYYLNLNKKEVTGWLQIIRGLPPYSY